LLDTSREQVANDLNLQLGEGLVAIGAAGEVLGKTRRQSDDAAVMQQDPLERGKQTARKRFAHGGLHATTKQRQQESADGGTESRVKRLLRVRLRARRPMDVATRSKDNRPAEATAKTPKAISWMLTLRCERF
jgi:hypothetical protein